MNPDLAERAANTMQRMLRWPSLFVAAHLMIIFPEMNPYFAEEISEIILGRHMDDEISPEFCKLMLEEAEAYVRAG